MREITETQEIVDESVHDWEYNELSGSMEEIISQLKIQDKSFREKHPLADDITYTLWGHWDEGVCLRGKYTRELTHEEKTKNKFLEWRSKAYDEYNEAVKNGKNVHERRRIYGEKIKQLEQQEARELHLVRSFLEGVDYD